MELVKQTLQGLAAHSAEEGTVGLGRHAQSIRLGTKLWQSGNAAPPKPPEETFFDDGTFPEMKDVKEAVQAAKKAVEERPAPFEGKTMPLANLTVTDFGNKLHDWIRAVQQEKASPTAEQLDVLRAVAERILQ